MKKVSEFDNKKVHLSIPQETHLEISKMADEDDRSINSQYLRIIKIGLDNIKKQK